MIGNLREKIIDNIKILIYKENLTLLKKLDFDNDEIFLEPLVFSYFNSKKDNSFPLKILQEILQGYFIKKESIIINYSFNKNDIAYIPQVGYFKKGKNDPYESILKKGDFEIIKEIHSTQEKYFVEFYKGHIVNYNPEHNSVWENYYRELFEAIDIIKHHLPDFL